MGKPRTVCFSWSPLSQRIDGSPESWRFVLPIFLHVGIVHLALNMISQIIAGAQVEREMGQSWILMSPCILT